MSKESESKFAKFSPFAVTLITALITATAGLIGSGLLYFQSSLARDLEKEKFQSLILLEQKKFETTLQLEQAKFESALILEAIKNRSPDTAAKNLRFFVSTGFIKDPGGKIQSTTEDVLGNQLFVLPGHMGPPPPKRRRPPTP